MKQNKNVIAMVARQNDKNNKTRSILVITAIFLTTMLLTILCVFANGLTKYNRANAGIQYGYFYGAWLSLEQGQIQEMRRRSEFEKVGTMAEAGKMEKKTEDGTNVEISLMTSDKTALALTNLNREIKEGNFPEQENEIALSSSVLEKLGYAGTGIGDVVTLPYRASLQQKYCDMDFVVSGLLVEENGVKSNRGRGYCSEMFYEAQFPEEQRRYNAYFSLKDSVPMNTDNAKDVILDLADRCGIEEKQVSVNGNYLLWKLDPGSETFSICAIIAVFVILFSVIVIYNIFQVGLAQKIQEYGKIKALGATKRQMRKLIYREGIYLAMPAIPAGLFVGYLAAVVSFQWLTGQAGGSADMISVSLFSPVMLLTAAFLAFITVVLSLRRPMKIVASISPVEAVRYQENASGKRGGLRKGKKEVTVMSMAMANIAGDGRRTLMTIFTMGLSCVLFVILSNWIGNIDEEYDARTYVRHGQFVISLDYSINDKAYPENNLDSVLKRNPLNEELLEELKKMDGVTEVRMEQLLLAQIDGKPDTVSVLSREDFEKSAEASSGIGNFDYDTVSKDNSIVFGWIYFMEEEGYSLNQPVKMELFNGKSSTVYSGKIAGSFGYMNSGNWAITEDTCQRLGLYGDGIGCVWVDCGKKDVPAVRQELEELLRGKEHIKVMEFESALRSSKKGARIMKVGCYLFLAIIGLIGFMNLANTMIINIITKKQEYGILQAVGMTNAQLNRSLQMQGIIFTIGTVLVAVAVGLPAGYGLFLYGKSESLFGLNRYHIPVAEILVMVAAVALLQVVLSFLLSRNLKKESLVERIRYQE